MDPSQKYPDEPSTPHSSSKMKKKQKNSLNRQRSEDICVASMLFSIQTRQQLTVQGQLLMNMYDKITLERVGPP